MNGTAITNIAVLCRYYNHEWSIWTPYECLRCGRGRA